jgi:hypothetical protein
MCECIEVITKGGYVGKSILGSPNYLLYPLEFKYDGKVKVQKQPYLFINYCPVCGNKLEVSE